MVVTYSNLDAFLSGKCGQLCGVEFVWIIYIFPLFLNACSFQIFF
jgi:hypothetical protein